jgi:hypothetical protein
MQMFYCCFLYAGKGVGLVWPCHVRLERLCDDAVRRAGAVIWQECPGCHEGRRDGFVIWKCCDSFYYLV